VWVAKSCLSINATEKREARTVNKYVIPRFRSFEHVQRSRRSRFAPPPGPRGRRQAAALIFNFTHPHLPSTTPQASHIAMHHDLWRPDIQIWMPGPAKRRARKFGRTTKMSRPGKSFDSRLLTRSGESRRDQSRALRADMRRSTVWRRCLAALSLLCLLQGYTRPVGKTEAWLVQHFLVPGHPASSPAARAADVASHFAEAFKMTHPRQCMESNLDPACRATIEWQCATQLRDVDIRVFRNARLWR
jgi:hypothetical protein